MIVYDKVYLVVSSPGTGINLPWLMKLPRGDLEQLSSLWRICLESGKGNSKKFSPGFSCFPDAFGPIAQMYVPKRNILG